MTLLQVHFFAVCFWLGLLAAETVMELHLRSGRNPGPIASIHRWIDLLFEGPAVVLVLVTVPFLPSHIFSAPLTIIEAARQEEALREVLHGR